MATTSQRGYGTEHQRTRREVAEWVETGEAVCTETICLHDDRSLDPGEPWDLAHDRTRPGHYRGPAHVLCNRSEGSRHRHAGIVRTVTL